MEDKMLTWPNWPVKLRTSSSHEEGAERDFAVITAQFEGDNGVVTGFECVRLDDKMKPIEGTEFTLKADLVLLAMGFVSPVKDGLLADLGVRSTRAATCSRTRRVTPPRSTSLRVRRHAARPVAGRLGDPRRPAMRGLDRRGLDGRDRPAEVIGLRRTLIGLASLLIALAATAGAVSIWIEIAASGHILQ